MPPWSRGLLITSRFVGSFDEFAVVELRADADQGNELGCVHRRQRACEDSIRL